MSPILRRGLPLVLAVLLIAAGWTQLDRYGVTWDEALGDLFFGQRYLSFFTSLDSRYLDFAADPYPDGHVPDLRSSEFRMRPWEYWPVANTLAAVTSRVLSGVFGLVDPFDGAHAFNLLAGAVLLVFLYRFVERARGWPEAVTACLILFLMPRVFCDLMANIKDFPEMVFFSLTLVAFFVAYEKGSASGVALAGVLWGMALGTKANAWFLPLVVAGFLVLRGFGPWSGRKARLAAALCCAGAAGVAVMVASWPYLWAAPLSRLAFTFKYLAFRSTHSGPGSTINPWVAIAATTPPLVLLSAAAGIVLLAQRVVRQREPFAAMTLAWLAVLAVRISTGVINYDGVRHFLEIFPPIAVAAAGAAGAAGAWVHSRFGARLTPAIALAALLPVGGSLGATIHAHPFQTAYWNAFVGGLSGAQNRGLPQACDYWASSYRDGIRWLNANVERNAVLLVPIAGHTVKLVAPVRLRPDIRYVGYPRGGGATAARQRLEETAAVAARFPVYVMFVPRRDMATELDLDCMKRLAPAAVWSLDGGPVLLVYRYRPPGFGGPQRSKEHGHHDDRRDVPHEPVP